MAGLIDALLGKRERTPLPPAPPAKGTIPGVAEILKSRAYQIHVMEAKAMGETPMTPEQFAAAQKK